jgi:hypothetical protein
MRAILFVLLGGLSIAMSPAADISAPVHSLSVESLNAILSRDGGPGTETRLMAMRSSLRGEIAGFVIE